MIGKIIFTMLLLTSSYAISYDCRDGSYRIIFNIDHNSLHFMVGKNVYVMKYDNIKRNNSKRVIGFKRFNSMMYVYYDKLVPSLLTLKEYRSEATGQSFNYKDNKLIYQYECKQDTIHKDYTINNIYE